MLATCSGAGSVPHDPTESGDLELDLRRYEIRRGGRALRLEKIPMELLILLIEKKE
jgi:hypothetical protein